LRRANRRAKACPAVLTCRNQLLPEISLKTKSADLSRNPHGGGRDVCGPQPFVKSSFDLRDEGVPSGRRCRKKLKNCFEIKRPLHVMFRGRLSLVDQNGKAPMSKILAFAMTGLISERLGNTTKPSVVGTLRKNLSERAPERLCVRAVSGVHAGRCAFTIHAGSRACSSISRNRPLAGFHAIFH